MNESTTQNDVTNQQESKRESVKMNLGRLALVFGALNALGVNPSDAYEKVVKEYDDE